MRFGSCSGCVMLPSGGTWWVLGQVPESRVIQSLFIEARYVAILRRVHPRILLA